MQGDSPAWLTPPSVSECVYEWMTGSIVKRFEWPLVIKALYKCSPFTILARQGREKWPQDLSTESRNILATRPLGLPRADW